MHYQRTRITLSLVPGRVPHDGVGVVIHVTAPREYERVVTIHAQANLFTINFNVCDSFRQFRNQDIYALVFGMKLIQRFRGIALAGPFYRQVSPQA